MENTQSKQAVLRKLDDQIERLILRNKVDSDEYRNAVRYRWLLTTEFEVLCQ